MSLELDGGKHVLAVTSEITKLVSRLASSDGCRLGSPCSSSLAVEGVRGRGRGSMSC